MSDPREALQTEEERQVYDMFSLIAEDPEECDVSWAIYAQAEVVLRDEEGEGDTRRPGTDGKEVRC